MFCITIEHKSSYDSFFSLYSHYTTKFFGHFGHAWPSLKTIMPILMFICMQKINFISNVFSEIFYRHCRLAILRTSGMLDHPHQNHSINLYETSMLICKQKINFITYFFLNILQRNSKLVILGNLEMSGPRN